MILPKVEIKRILYATDLSPYALKAFAYAVSLSNLYQAPLTIVHVVTEDPDLDEKVIGYISAEQWDQIKQQHVEDARQVLIGKQRDHLVIREVLDKFCESAQNGCEDQSFVADDIVVKRGDAVEELLAQAEKSQCDLIVMGSHGYGTFKDAMMGGTARRVSRRANVPVLLVRLPTEE